MTSYYVYILANKKNGTLYVGFTDNLIRRMYEHKNKIYKGFTSKYDINKLVYFEKALTADEAKVKEKRIKKWNRQWKINLIQRHNPEWKDLSRDFPTDYDGDILEPLFGTKNEIVLK